MKLTPWLVLLCLGLVGCSGSKSAQKVDESSPQIELSDADEFVENPSEEAVPEVAIDPGESADPTDDPMVTDTDAPAEDEAININDEIAPGAAPVAKASSDFEAGATKQYNVGKNETLMLIAFKLYGDYEKWKNLANQNQNVLKGRTSVKEGMVLTYTAPAEEFVWNQNGSPYLIRTGDTLGTISKSVYQTMSKWKMLWDNNRPLIKDPNKIYSGFTIYYVDGQKVAAEF
ncbi:MAG TPA: hypothetical protein VNJ08_10040 [Bacteriovoracaceae bacterium]|nr:hypothetical protein [Bacteriovoracaceae bacterium]